MADGSPPKVPFKYAWGGLDDGLAATLPSGAGDAASNRLYQHAKTTGRTVREERQREAQRAAKQQQQQQQQQQRPETAASLARSRAKAKETAQRFSKVMASTAAGRYQQEIMAIAHVKGGTEASERVRDAFNYGDMLFQEGAMQRSRREEARRQELQRREELEDCTFRPQVSEKAAEFAHRDHIGERSEQLAAERAQRREVLARTVRQETERDLTFQPTVTNKKSRAMMNNYGPFLDEMKLRDTSKAERMQQLRDLRQKEERREHTFKPQIRPAPSNGARPQSARASTSPTKSPKGAAANGAEEEPAYNRLYKQHTSAYASTLVPAATSDAECTFQPNMAGGKGGATSKVPATRSRQHLEQVGDALYKDAHNRRIRAQMVQEQIDAGLADVRNERRISARSGRLAFQKLEKDVLDVYDRLEALERGLSYAELSDALVFLGVIRHP